MKSLPPLVSLLAILAAGSSLMAAPLRVLVASDDNAFSDPYSAALKSGGAQIVVTSEPDEAKLSHADVVLIHRKKFEAYTVATQSALTAFANRGGGIVAVNGAIAAGTAEWGKATLGGGWDEKDSRKFSSLMMLYVVSNSHPIVKDSSPFDIVDETLYDLTLSDDIFVLGSAFTPKGRDAKRGDGPNVPGRDVRASIYDLQPQMWTYETPKHRAAVFLQGAPETLAHASMRSFILRAVAWTAKRENVDEFCTKADLATLRYPAGGPRRAEDEIKQFKMQPGFVASVVAEEPLINKPIAIQWDGAGRLWVAETPEYPNGKRPLKGPAWKETGVLDPGHYDRPGRDSISILEDSNHDGKMDKKHVFYTGLELVTGFCLHEDGVIAVAQPNIVYLQDVNGDGTADTATPLFGGFAPGDTHFVANHFNSAPDGWIYASTGSGADATDPKSGKVMAKISPGVFRFRPDGSAIEQVASQGGNSFGGEVTSDMEIFHGKATSGNPIQYVVLPEWVLSKAPNTKAPSFVSVNPGRTVARTDLSDRAPIMQIDQVGRYSAACSTAIYEGGAWPKEYDGKIFTSEPILDIIHFEELKPDGPSLKGELVLKDQEWLRSMDYWFCPVDVSFGPDGAMYVLDFYTPVVTHNDTRGPAHSASGASIRPDRDQYFGRIYRIQSASATKFPIPDLYKANAAALVAAFKHPNKTVRFNAIRILLEKPKDFGKQAVPALTAMATGESFAPARILALWALQRLGELKPATLDTAFSASEATVRKNAMLIAESGGIPLAAKEASAGIADKDARVRLATLRALGASPMSPEVTSLLLASGGKFPDDWSKAAADAASARNPSSQLETILTEAGNAGQSEESVRSLASSLASGGNQGQLLGVLQASSSSPNPKLVAVVLTDLGKSPPAAPRNLSAALEALRPILASSDRALAAAALPLAVAWDKSGFLNKEITKAAGELIAVARDPKQPDLVRADAIRTLLPARSANKFILPNILALLTKPQPDSLGIPLVTSLATTGEPEAGSALTDAYPTLPPGQQEADFTALVGRPTWTKLLLDAIESKKIPASSFGPAQISRLTSHPDAETAKRASALFGGPGSGAEPGKDQIITQLLPQIEKPANIANGKQMFTAVCSMCHQLEGAGNVFGPDLSGIGSHPYLELLTHIVNPSLVVDDEHRTWNIVMKDGTLYSALIASENDARVQIRQPGGVTIDLKPGDIASRKKGENSLMPEGLEAMGADNLRDIIGYIRSCAPKTTH
ncbi:MAG: PVC-type heme-binding CxxCH protein [Luteolibacter sp.]|uniref:PVC-type heme-binding CxxCH protein n=1 Tax=Luteolibacter sp. TaxID=1962973 RepID=UPI003266A4C8